MGIDCEYNAWECREIPGWQTQIGEGVAAQKTDQGALFDDRFLDKYAGPNISDPAVAIVELVANAWDAYATKVDIVWPKRSQNLSLLITDNGKCMTSA